MFRTRIGTIKHASSCREHADGRKTCRRISRCEAPVCKNSVFHFEGDCWNQARDHRRHHARNAVWLWPEFTRGLDFRNPVEPVRRAIARAKKGGADAILVTGHMGLKTRTGGDDFANTVMALTSESPEVAVFIAGHTHQDVPSRLTNGVLFTQADHFVIHVG